MATKTVTHLTDNLDGSTENVETVKFGLHGAEYELDLTKENPRRAHRCPRALPQPRDPPPHRRRRLGAPPACGGLPRRGLLIRLVGAVLAEQHDEQTEGRRYLGLDVLHRSRLSAVPATDSKEGTATPALSA